MRVRYLPARPLFLVHATATPNTRTRTFIVDALNRTTTETVAPADPAEIATTAYRHDGNGNVIQIDEMLGTGSRRALRHYDAFDRLDADTDVHGKALVYGYDPVGNRTSLTDVTDPNAAITITSWSYNDLNQNDSVTVPGQGTTHIESTPSGLVHVVTRPDSSTTTTEYDASGRVATIVHAKGGSEIAHTNYPRYDLNGNRIEQDESNGTVTNATEQQTTYTYDRADRLTDITAPERTTHYDLDPVGNRATEQIKDSQNTLIGNSTLTYNEREQLTNRDDAVTNQHIGLTYDADGNTQTEIDDAGTRTYTVDAHDRVIGLSVPGQLPLTFDYQSDGMRLGKHQGSAETRYQYDGQSLLAETNAIGNTLVRYHYSASQLLSRSETTSTPTERHYLLDALHTPIALLTQDGAVSARTRYDAWGEILAQQGTGGALTTPLRNGTKAQLPTTDQQAIGFTGYMKDAETGLYYAKARYYDPRIARFATEDPEEGNAMQPPSLHRYLYAYANPTVYVDPTGRCVEPLTFVLCAAVLGGEIGFASDFLVQEHQSLDAGRSDSLGSFAANDYDVKRGALNTAVGVVTGPIAPGLGTVGVRASISVATAVTVGAGLQTGVEAATTTDPNFDPKTSFLRNEAVGIGLAVAGPIVSTVVRGVVSKIAGGLRAPAPSSAAIVKESANGDANAAFEPQGLDVDPRQTPEGQRLYAHLRSSDKTSSDQKILDRAQDLLRTGVGNPTMRGIKQGEELIKVVPQGKEVESYSPFFMEPAQWGFYPVFADG